MKISEAWLREWINPPLSTQDLANQLTMAGLEVDAVTPAAGQFDHVIVAKVLQTKPHPQADRLTLCTVETGHGEPLAVVCGASNVRPGLMVALAQIGAHLPNGMEIKETKLRGELSQGMLCAADELGLIGTSEGILELAADAPIGQDFREYLALDDHIFDIDLTPNRADCLSVLGIARDLAALNRLPHVPLTVPTIKTETDIQYTVHLDDAHACPHYVGRVMTHINPHASTPTYIIERLRRSDIRVIHPVVDVLNYVMLELGQPMHAFDLRHIAGTLHVRKAKPGEALQLLNGQDLVLDTASLVIADDEKPLALAGIMGGAHSGVQNDTVDIWIEAAFFTPQAIAGEARRFGLATDASHRFERGVDPNISIQALDIATALLQKLVGGQIGPMVQRTATGFSCQPAIITFHPQTVARLSGVEISDTTIQRILEQLGMRIDTHGDTWQVTVPTYRFDLHAEVDLVEEVIRIYGYDKIPTRPIMSTIQSGHLDPMDQIAATAMQFLAYRGYQEIISYSFVDPQVQQIIYPDVATKLLLNPISPELSAMRVGLWSGLLAAMVHNLHRQHSSLKLCETGKLFLVNGDQIEEKLACAGLMVGTHSQYNWSETPTTYDFFDLKGDLEALFAAIERPTLQFVAGEHPALHPGKTAQIICGSEHVGWIGALHPRIVDALDIDMETIVFEFLVPALPKPISIKYQTISKYPQIRRDLSILVDKTVSAAAIETVVRTVVDPKILKSFYIFDVYTGSGLAAEDKKSVALGMLLQSNERTLVDDEIHAMVTSVIEALEQKLQAVLRDKNNDIGK